MNSPNLNNLRDKTIIITGADGMLGRAFEECLVNKAPSANVSCFSRSRLDVTDRNSVLNLTSLDPDIIIHCAGLTNADECTRNPDLAYNVHYKGTKNIIELAQNNSALVIYPQSVFIFDGQELPVTEKTKPCPPFVYGKAKLMAEQSLLDELENVLIVRMAGFFGGDDKDKNFVGQFVRSLRDMKKDGRCAIEVGDRIWQPTYTLDLALNTLLLAALDKRGIYHMGALGEATFYEVALACIEFLGLENAIKLLPISSAVFDDNENARRPKRMVTRNDRLDSEGINYQRHWRDALREYLERPYFKNLKTSSRINDDQK
ncbi:NAD(P)-dependent oxidoreductase [Marinobacter panjinensis]|uniref:dTDP-4-dehydrorhamnose reductase n=1 Tax=Marinobacter panjinensis TaxID=2576384 RepID=A0A4U6R1H4_9GAMM|nr:sugar nucleotide-binding protein [Marinobacter panjinensis]MCR8915767.1 sugar nucleotide-binding protein [Marinobacter panjinensis]TKV67249.1 NAD(P)-dependent oxidoreductase [Marinobacter panjinensis]